MAHRKGRGTPLATQDGDHSALEAQTLAWKAAIKTPSDYMSTDDDSEAPYGSSAETELKLEPLLEAFAGTLRIGESFGPLFSLAVKNDEANIDKVRAAGAGLGSGTDGTQNVTTLRGLLEAERASGIHQPGGVLADPSAAIALVWLRRGLVFQNTSFENLLNDRTITVSAASKEAYKNHLEVFHNFWLKNTFRAGLSAMPKREDFIVRLAPHLKDPAERESTVYAEMQELVDVQNHVVAVMNALFVELDLEDLRKA